MRSLFLLCVFVGLCLADMNIVYLKQAAATTGAVCLDGSPAAYYFKAGSAANSTKWSIDIQGGGWCYSEKDCAVRAQTYLGSSTQMGTSISYSATLSEDKAMNPEFYDWNHVLMAYCDGASFSGDRADPINVDGKLIYFRGFRILKAIIKDLLENKGMNKATDVLLTGESAGGLAVYLHADQIKDMLPGSVRRYKAVPMSGVFLDHPNAEDVPVYTPQIKYVFQMQNCTGGVNVRCLVSKSPLYMHLCMMAEYTMQFTETPLFITNSAYDSWSTRCILGAEPVLDPTQNGNCSAVPGWAACENDPSQCTQNQWDKIEAWGRDYSDRIESNAAASADGNALYEYSCHYHTAEMTEYWGHIAVQGTLIRDAINKWYYSKNEPASKHTYKDCKNHGSYCCNPTCCSPPSVY